MRIVGGEWRGRALAAPRGRAVSRPTTDRVREAIASMVDAALPQGIAGASVLDAFAGTGALGLEMLSRGARFAALFDTDRGAAALVRRNLELVGCERQRARVTVGVAADRARRGRIDGAPFDLVLMDPPYALGCAPAAELLDALAAAGALRPGAIALFERDAVKTPALALPGFEAVREKRYGGTCIDVLRWCGPNGLESTDD